VVVDPQDVATARVRMSVEAASIDTANGRRDNHLRSEDFFHVERFPAIVFESQRVEGTGASLRVVGHLTIRGVTREVTIPVEVELARDRVVARGEFVLNRHDYGISYSSFLNPIGDAVRVAFVFRGRPG
jgi:polyisoprenoid-binding protein YceI